MLEKRVKYVCCYEASATCEEDSRHDAGVLLSQRCACFSVLSDR